MAINNPPLVTFGVDNSLQNSIQLTLFDAKVCDPSVTALGTTQANGYQVKSGATFVNAAAAGTGLVLPPTSSFFGDGGIPGALTVWIAVSSGVAAFPNVYPHPNDGGSATINGAASVVLGNNTLTPFQAFAAGQWFADSIGTGAVGSLETIVSQGNVASAGTTQANATAITQALVNFTSGGADPAGGTLPVASAGLQVAVANNTGGIIRIYGNGTDTINGGSGATGVTQANALVTIYICATNGNWLTK
jgi:hypothetical protein